MGVKPRARIGMGTCRKCNEQCPPEDEDRLCIECFCDFVSYAHDKHPNQPIIAAWHGVQLTKDGEVILDEWLSEEA